MNILIISPFFFPEKISTGKYNTQLALKIKDKVENCDIDVFCSHPLYPGWKPELSTEKLPGINILRSGSWLVYPSSTILRRALLEFWFFISTAAKVIRMRKKYDLVISVYPPNLASLVSRFLFKGSPRHVGIIHDIQSVLLRSKKGKIRDFFYYIVSKIESESYKGCDKLIFLSNEMMSFSEKKFGIKNIDSTVCYPFITLNNTDQSDRALDEIISRSDKNIVYSGALGEKQSPDDMLEIFRRLKEYDSSINIFIFSQGDVFERLKTEQRNSSIKFYPLVAEHNLPELLARSTVQVIPQNPESSEGAFPSKLPNILASGCKVFSVTAEGSELNKVLEQYSKSLVFHSWSDEMAVKKLVDFTNASINGSSNDKSLLEIFSIDYLIKNIIST